MSQKSVYGFNTNGELSPCRAKPENRGRGKCNHAVHVNLSQEEALDYEENRAKREAAVDRLMSAVSNDKFNSLDLQGKLEAIERNEDNASLALCNDFNWEVRRLIALKEGRKFFCDNFAKDFDYRVRAAGCRYLQGEELKEYLQDPDPRFRAEVASYGVDECLDILVDDPDPNVRIEVAKHGRDEDLDVLRDDDNDKVVDAVLAHCRSEDLDYLSSDPYSFRMTGKDDDYVNYRHDYDEYDDDYDDEEEDDF